MKKLKNVPSTLLRKLYGTALIGMGCLMIGILYYIYAGDRILLALSVLMLVFSLIRSAGLYRVIAERKYETIEGVCVGITQKPFSRLQKIRVMDAEGIENTLHLSKQTRLRIGAGYRFYLKETAGKTMDSDFISSALLSDAFLGSVSVKAFDPPFYAPFAIDKNHLSSSQ